MTVSLGDRTSAGGRLFSPRRWLTLLVGVALGLGLFGLALRDVSWDAVRSSLSRVNVGWLSLAVICVVLVALVKAERWRWLFYPHHYSLASLDVLAILLLGQVVNILLPVRLGEILRAGMLTRISDLRLTVVVGTIVVEKLVDSLVVAAMALLLGSTLISLTGHVGASAVMVFVTLTALASLALALGRRQAVPARLERALGRWSSGRWLASKISAFLRGFDMLQHRRAWQALGGWTALTWALSVLTILLTFAAFGFSVPPVAALLIVVIINLGLVLPAAPGLIGLIQYVSVLVLTRYGVETSVSFGYGLVLHLVLVAPLLLLALWAWFRSRAVGASRGWTKAVIEDETRTQVA